MPAPGVAHAGSGLKFGLLAAGVFVVLSALLVGRGEAIVCYDCNSEYDPRCGDPFDPYTLGTIDCKERPPRDHLSGTNATLCRKLVQKISGKIRVVRTCGFIVDPDRDGGCVSRSGTHDVNVLYCSCNSTLCNAAPGTPRPRSPALLAALLLPCLLPAVLTAL